MTEQVMADTRLMTSGRHSETSDLTGSQTREGQIDNLTRNGIPFTVGNDGWPRVFTPLHGSGKRTTPNFAALKKTGKRGAA
jgi:hypothetical protein